MKPSNSLVSQVRNLILSRTKNAVLSYGYAVNPETVMPGKMLRTRLAARLANCDIPQADPDTLVRVCAATELVHTASLLHDDVIDNGQIRRGVQTLWKSTSPSQAVLVGDVILCEALELILETEKGRYSTHFIAKVREVCLAEIEQEIILLGERLDEKTCVRLARGKTGPFFAFVCYVFGGVNSALCSALEDAGYHIGTAYQLADDLLDIVGDEGITGKTLGSDLKRGKYTFPQAPEATHEIVCGKITGLCSSALECLNEWPQVQNGLGHFIEYDLKPALGKFTSITKVTC